MKEKRSKQTHAQNPHSKLPNASLTHIKEEKLQDRYNVLLYKKYAHFLQVHFNCASYFSKN